MIVRNLEDKEVLDTTYLAHGGAVAQMVLDRRVLKEIGFLACATLEKGKAIEPHVDPMEEIYFIMSGEGEWVPSKVKIKAKHKKTTKEVEDEVGVKLSKKLAKEKDLTIWGDEKEKDKDK